MDPKNEVVVQLATRIPKSLHQKLRLHCVQIDTTVMDFVVAAIREKLARERTRRGGSPSGD